MQRVPGTGSAVGNAQWVTVASWGAGKEEAVWKG